MDGGNRLLHPHDCVPNTTLYSTLTRLGSKACDDLCCVQLHHSTSHAHCNVACLNGWNMSRMCFFFGVGRVHFFFWLKSHVEKEFDNAMACDLRQKQNAICAFFLCCATYIQFKVHPPPPALCASTVLSKHGSRLTVAFLVFCDNGSVVRNVM